MSLHEKFWKPGEKILIESIKQYPFLYTKNITLPKEKYAILSKPIWLDITIKTGFSTLVCKRKWIQIRSRYAILKNMINNRKVSQKIIACDPRISKYLDGTLNFLDPYVNKIIASGIYEQKDFEMLLLNPKIPTQPLSTTILAPRKVKKLLEKRKDELDHPDMNYLMQVVEIAVLNSLKKIDPNINNAIDCSSNKDEETCCEAGSVKESNLSNTKIAVTEIGIDKVNKNTSTDSETIKHIIPDIKTEYSANNTSRNKILKSQVTCDSVDMFLIKYNINNEEVGIKQYLKDLSELLCQQLTFEKRKAFLSQIDLLVSKILEE